MTHSPTLRLATILLIALLAVLPPEIAHAQSSRAGEVSRPMKTAGSALRHIAGMAADSGVLRLNRDAIDFGVVDFGREAHDSVAVMNQGSAELVVQRVRIIGPGAASFLIVASLDGVGLPASRFAWQAVTFRPLDSGCVEAGLVVESSVGADTIALRGCSSYVTTSIGIDTLDFPLTRVDSCTTVLDTITNTTPDTLRLLAGIVADGAFRAETFPLATPVVIPPGMSFGPIIVRFCPESVGVENGSARLVTDRGVITIVLRGHGGMPMMEIVPDTLDFGRTPVGGHRDAAVIVRNPGSFPLRITRSPGSSTFGRAPGEPAVVTVDPGSSGSLSYRFAPDRGAGYFATDTLSTNTFDGRFILPLHGEGVAGYLLQLDTVSGAVGDTLRLRLRLDPPRDSSVRIMGWNVRLRVDRHALRILGLSAASPRVNMTRLDDDIVGIDSREVVPIGDLLAMIDIVGLSTARPVNPVTILDASLDSVALLGTSDGSVMLSGCIIGNAVPLARRSVITGLRWDASGALAVRYLLPGRATGRVRVVDMLGRELLRADVPGPGDQEREVVLPMPGAPVGIYFVELLVADDRCVMPAMKER